VSLSGKLFVVVNNFADFYTGVPVKSATVFISGCIYCYRCRQSVLYSTVAKLRGLFRAGDVRKVT
jgi:hypothetical protein